VGKRGFILVPGCLGGWARCVCQALTSARAGDVLWLSRYVGNAAYNVYNKKACTNIHAHWSVAFAQLVVRLSP
jgi:hypothetical protein